MKKKNRFTILIIILIAISIVFIVCIPKKMWDKNSWQAVFLNNNQVYFGKIEKVTKNNVVLTNIYYLQASDYLSSEDEDNAKLNLVKLGSEVHGPQDLMVINRTNVLFWENLKNDSKIVKIIEKIK